MRRADAVIATARLSLRVRSAIDAAIVTAVSTDASVPTPAWTARSRSSGDPQVGGLLEVELLDVQLGVPRARQPVDPVDRVAVHVGADGADERAWPPRSGDVVRVVPSIGDGGRRQCGSSMTSGKTTTLVGWPISISLVKRPNGSPVRTRRAPSR